MEKQYVRVNGNWEEDGSFIPLFILWENGLKYKIEKIVQRCPAVSLKSGGAGCATPVCFPRGSGGIPVLLRKSLVY
ncbi:MAG: hypothetical protein ACLSA6_08725 [Holdemania massiliensis]